MIVNPPPPPKGVHVVYGWSLGCKLFKIHRTTFIFVSFFYQIRLFRFLTNFEFWKNRSSCSDKKKLREIFFLINSLIFYYFFGKCLTVITYTTFCDTFLLKKMKVGLEI